MSDTPANTVETFDVIILGAGINGAGLFRELSLQGLRCLIVDRADFGSGTSAAPSRLIHGGIKYLETGELGLVAQSTLERNRLLCNAPHCVTPLPTFIPAFSFARGMGAALRTLFGATSAPRSRGALLIKIGMMLYDLYGARQRVMPKHRFLLRRQALAEIPTITPRIVAAGIYYDAKISRPERLVWELISDALAAHPDACARNFTALIGQEQGVLQLRGPHGHTQHVRASIVVNAAGPWIDSVNALLGLPGKLIGGTKGSHILLQHPELVASLKGRMIYFEADDGRICLVYEFLGLALVGSTDIKADDPDQVRCEDGEIDYLLASLRTLLPGLSFDRSQIVYVYSGIRPLPASNTSEPGLISRDHSAPVAPATPARPFCVISLVGGKWTTFRGFAEEVANDILARLGRTRQVSTQQLPIGGGRNFPCEPAARAAWIAKRATQSGLPAARIDALLTRYGTTADALLAHIRARADIPLTHIAGYSHAEIDWIARHENIEHLADLVMRRTTLAIEGKLTAPGLAELAAILAQALDWDASRQAKELAATSTQLKTVNRIKL